jgi:glycosyltransferase involved in cell wall biosynthesis
MKIVQICLCGSYNPNMGYQDNILPKYYIELGFECLTITSEYYKDRGEIVRSKRRSRTLKDGSVLIRIPNKFNIPYKLNKTLRLYKGLFTILEEEKPDIIFLHNFQFLSFGDVIKYCKKNPDVVVYADSHTDYVNSGRNWISFNILHKLVWRYCSKRLEPYIKKFWGVTEQRCQFLEKVYDIPKEKIDLLVMGADIGESYFKNQANIRNTIRKKIGISDDDFLLITGGKIDKQKNIHLLIEAIKKIKNKPIKLLIFGEFNVDMEYLLEEIDKNNKILYIGWINSNEVYDYFLASDLGIFPGTHSVLWEQAVGSGLPCIFKAWDGMKHVDVGGNCLFLDTNDIDEIVSKIYKVTDGRLYKSMKEVAIRNGVKTFSYKNIAKRSIEL